MTVRQGLAEFAAYAGTVIFWAFAFLWMSGIITYCLLTESIK